MTNPEFPKAVILKRTDVAQILRTSPKTLSRKLPMLERRGFPKKLPGLNGWSAACVRAWIESNGDLSRPLNTNVALAEAGNALDAEYAA